MAEAEESAVAVYRRIADANLRYYQAWGKLAVTWLSEVAELGKGLPGSFTPAEHALVAAETHHVHAPPHDSHGPSTPSTTSGSGTSRSTLVLEGVAGGAVTSAFLVENILGHPTEANVLAETPEDSDRGVVLAFDPDRVELAPLERRVVRVRATLPRDMPVGSEHKVTIKVPDLPGSSIAALVRCIDGGGD